MKRSSLRRVTFFITPQVLPALGALHFHSTARVRTCRL